MQTSVSIVLAPQIYDSSALALLYARAYHCAARQHVTPNDRADCAQAFLVHLLMHGHLKAALSSKSFAMLCATNFARNYCRDCACTARHETACPQYTNEDGEMANQEFPCKGHSSHAGMVEKETRLTLTDALHLLTAAHRGLVTRHFCEGESFVALAEATHSTPDAVRMTVNRACKRLRVLMGNLDFTEEDANEYLAETGLSRGGGENTRNGTVRILQKTLPYLFGSAFEKCDSRVGARIRARQSKSGPFPPSDQEQRKRTACILPKECVCSITHSFGYVNPVTAHFLCLRRDTQGRSRIWFLPDPQSLRRLCPP